MKNFAAHPEGRRNGFRYASFAMIAAGIVGLGYAAAVNIHRDMFQAEAARMFATSPAGHQTGAARLTSGALLGRLVIPRLGLAAMVAEGDSNGILRRAVGHIPGTALPGGDGNVALAGHRDTFFRPLRLVRPGDEIQMQTANGTYLYQVKFTEEVAATQVSVLRETSQPSLTLVTCYPFFYIGPAPRRFIVRARLVGIERPGRTMRAEAGTAKIEPAAAGITPGEARRLLLTDTR